MNPLDSAKLELDSLLKQREELDGKIAAVTRSISILSPFYEETAETVTLSELIEATSGITQAVEAALQSKADKTLYPTQVRDLLVENGYRFKSDNPMAIVHTILKRLAARQNSGVISAEDDAGRTMYMFVSQKFRATTAHPLYGTTVTEPVLPPKDK